MAKNSAIEWTHSTWNPWTGCKKVSPGCKNCYMFRDQERYGRDPRTIKRTSPQTFNAPLKWKEAARVFTCSWSDFFIEQADGWRDEAWDIIRRTPHLTYQILTKRPENMEKRLPVDWGNGWDNVWFGVSVESNEYLSRIETLSLIPAVVRFVSYEPALGPLDLSRHAWAVQWLISGGESGKEARSANTDWFVSIRDQCAQHGVAYFHKQNGGNRRINGTWGGNELQGNVHRQFPIKLKHNTPNENILEGLNAIQNSGLVLTPAPTRV